MASKASMLKKGASKTGTGLFKGMTPIGGEEVKTSIPPKKEETTSNVTVEPVKEVEDVTPKKQNVEEPIINEPVVEETVKEFKAEPVKSEVVEKVKEDKQPTKKESVEELSVQEIVDRIPVEPLNARKDAAKETKSKQEKASRYEKDKFLLLDVRGLRDYVEHMAKAANMSATKYIRSLIEQDMNKNMDIYEAHKALEERLKGRNI